MGMLKLELRVLLGLLPTLGSLECCAGLQQLTIHHDNAERPPESEKLASALAEALW